VKRFWALLLPPLAVGLLGSSTAHKDGGFGGSEAVGTFVGGQWDTCNPDDCPGILDGAGADPNPFTASRASRIRTGVLGSPFTNDVDHVHFLSSYNMAGSSTRGPSLTSYSSQLFFEYSFDQTFRSGAELVEWNWDIQPATHTIAFNSDIDPAAGSITLGDNVTFSNGAICRASATAVVTGTHRMTCNNLTPPADNNTITACTSGCDGTVNGVPTSETAQWRPFQMLWRSAQNDVTFVYNLSPARPAIGASSARLNLGWDGATVSDIKPRIVSAAVMTGGGFAGDLAYDETQGQLLVGNGAVMQAYEPWHEECRAIRPTPVSGTNYYVMRAERALTILGVDCITVDGTSQVLTPQECTNASCGTTSNIEAAMTCVPSATVSEAAGLDDAVIAAGNWIRVNAGTNTGTVNEAILCITYEITRQ